jgi:putative MATE family efflux protein
MRSTSPLKDILKTSLPAVVDLSSQTIMWTIEAILVGMISAAAFAGVGMAIQIIILFFAFLLAFVVGSSVIINRYLGADNTWEANHILAQALIMGMIIAIITGLTWYFGAAMLFKLIRESEPIAQQSGVQYLRILSGFAPLIITNFIAVGIIRGAGDTKISMLLNLLINILNLTLAPLLIFGKFGFPEMGVRGAAYAVGISHSIGFFATLIVLRSRKSRLFLSFREVTTPNLRSFKSLFKLGLPTTVEQLSWAVGQMVITGYAALLGITFLAAHQVFMRLQAILTMFFMGFSLGAMTLVGQNIGASEHRRAEQTGKMAGYVALAFVLMIVFAIVFFAKPIMSIFTSNSEVIAIGAKVVYLYAAIQIPKALNTVLGGNLRGAGDLKWLMFLSIISVLLMEISAAWFAAFVLGLSLWGLWMVMGIDEVIRVFLNYWRFHGGKWKLIDV